MGINDNFKNALLVVGLLSGLTITSISQAQESQLEVHALKNLENLSPEQRRLIRAQINLFLEANPGFDPKSVHFVIDKNGDIYVLDKNNIISRSNAPLSQPSCVE